MSVRTQPSPPSRGGRVPARLRGRGRRGGDPTVNQGVFRLVKGLLMFESVQYSAITPVLPHYAHVFGASKGQIGVLAAAYAAGLIPGSVIGGGMAGRTGVRRTTAAGLFVFALATAAFGFGDSLLSLDILRAIQGVACGLIWGGALTWVIAVAPRERRGELLGSVIAAAIIGTLIGPIVGTLAVSVGTEFAFGLVGAVSVALAVRVGGYAEPPPPAEANAGRARRPRGNRTLWLGAWLVALGAGLFGAINALVPLRLSGYGASSLAIGATFFIGAAASAALAPVLGRLTDRRGAAVPMCGGLVVGAAVVASLPLPHVAWLLASLSVIATGGPVTSWMVPAASWMTDSAEQLGISLTVGTMLFNLAFALGETVGAPAAAGLAQATGDAVPFLVLAGVMVASLVAVLAGRARPAPGRGLRAAGRG